MAKRVIPIVLILLIAGLAFVGYHSYDAKRAGGSGAVYSLDGSPERINDKGSSSDAKTGAAAADDDTVVYPSSQPQPQQADSTGAANSDTGGAQVTQSAQPGTGVPTADTISPNPPNGMTFAGSGRYQLYRQGNITWRLDTDTGRSCVLFATDEEWKKPRVYRTGCAGK